MQNLNDIRTKIAKMSNLVLKMWETAYGAFVEHDLELLREVLEIEDNVNDMESDITLALIEIGRSVSDKKEKLTVAVYTDVIGDLELIGDYCKDILERVQIKIEERLLFSVEAVEEYQELYRISERALKEVVEALHSEEPTQIERVLKSKRDVDALVEEYRRKHTERLMTGACDPRSGNMFLNMLDFAAAIYKHVVKIASDLHKLN